MREIGLRRRDWSSLYRSCPRIALADGPPLRKVPDDAADDDVGFPVGIGVRGDAVESCHEGKRRPFRVSRECERTNYRVACDERSCAVGHSLRRGEGVEARLTLL